MQVDRPTIVRMIDYSMIDYSRMGCVQGHITPMTSSDLKDHFSNSHTSGDIACINCDMFTHDLQSVCSLSQVNELSYRN